MDFKMILILLIILVVVLFATREILNIKKQLTNKNENLENTVKVLKNKVENITTEIKNYNNDLLTQAKKIHKINSQKITNMSNYYTESESSCNKNLLEYLSEAQNKCMTPEDFKINFSPINSPNNEDTQNLIHAIVVKCSNLNNTDLPIFEENNNIVEINTINSSSITSTNQTIDVDISNVLIVSNKQNQETNIVNQEITTLTSISDDNDVISNDDSINNDASNNLLNDNVINNNVINDKKEDTISLDTTTTFNITRLNPLNSYTKSDLDKIARRLLIPTTYLDGTSRKSYKKEELYLKINEVLNKKSNQ